MSGQYINMQEGSNRNVRGERRIKTEPEEWPSFYTHTHSYRQNVLFSFTRDASQGQK